MVSRAGDLPSRLKLGCLDGGGVRQEREREREGQGGRAKPVPSLRYGAEPAMCVCFLEPLAFLRMKSQ